MAFDRIHRVAWRIVAPVRRNRLIPDGGRLRPAEGDPSRNDTRADDAVLDRAQGIAGFLHGLEVIQAREGVVQVVVHGAVAVRGESVHGELDKICGVAVTLAGQQMRGPKGGVMVSRHPTRDGPFVRLRLRANVVRGPVEAPGDLASERRHSPPPEEHELIVPIAPDAVAVLRE